MIFPVKWLQHNESAGAPWPANWMKWSSFAHHRTLKGISNVLTGCNGYQWGNELKERSVHHQQWLSPWAEYDAQRKTLKREKMRGCTKNKLHIVQVIEDSKRHAQNTTEKIWRRLSSAQWSRCQLGCSGSQNLPGSNYRRIICPCSYHMEHAKILIKQIREQIVLQ